MKNVVRFAEKHKLVILADEVYQENIWGDKPWYSFRKVKMDMKSPVELFSYHSISKGFYGECGLRGGFMNLEDIDEDVRLQLTKLQSISLCSNTLGQAMMTSICNPPVEGDPSYPLYNEEKTAILKSMKNKAHLIYDRLNAIPGISCQPVEGAMYAFPALQFPDGVAKAAAKKGLMADELFCSELLEKTGILVIPGTGFKQKEGTWHFRTTILPPEEKFPKILDKFEKFHNNFIGDYCMR